MPSKSTLAVIATLAYGASVMALPVVTTGRADATAVTTPALNVTSAAVVDPSHDQAANGTHHHSHHHLHHLHLHRHHHLTNEDGTPAEHHHRHHLFHHHSHHNATTLAAQNSSSTTPLDPSTQKLVRRSDETHRPHHHHHHHHHRHPHPDAQAAADPTSDPTQTPTGDGSGLSRRDLSQTNSTVGSAISDSKSTPLSSTSNPAPAQKESLGHKWHRQRQERRAKKQQDKARKQNEKKEHERQKLLEKHRQSEAEFLVKNAGIDHGHLRGKDLKRAVAAKEKELLEKEKLAAARSQTASSLPHTGNPLPGSLSGSPSSLPPLNSRSGVAIPPRMN